MLTNLIYFPLNHETKPFRCILRGNETLTKTLRIPCHIYEQPYVFEQISAIKKFQVSNNNHASYTSPSESQSCKHASQVLKRQSKLTEKAYAVTKQRRE